MGPTRYAQRCFRLVVTVLAGVSAAGLPGSQAAQAAPSIPSSSAPAASQPSGAADWPQYMGPTGDQAAAPSAVPLARSWPTEGPRVAWSLDNLKPVGLSIGAGVCISAGKVYLAERHTLKGYKNRAGNLCHNYTKYSRMSAGADTLRCVDLATGQEYWRYTHPAYGDNRYFGPISTPAVDERHVYFTGPTGWLYCLDKNTGQEVWKCDATERYGVWLCTTAGYTNSPMLYKDMVALSLYGAKASAVAFEKTTGRVRWEAPVVPYLPSEGNFNCTSPTLARFGGVDQFVVTLFAKKVFSVAADDGRLLWEVNDNHISCVYGQPMVLPDAQQVIITPSAVSSETATVRIAVESKPEGLVAKSSVFGPTKVSKSRLMARR